MTPIEWFNYIPNCVALRPTIDLLPKYIAAIRSGMRTSTALLAEGDDGSKARMDEAFIIEANAPSFIEALNSDPDYIVFWLFNGDTFVGMFKIALGTDRLLPDSLGDGHAGWIIHPDHRRKGYGTAAVHYAMNFSARKHLILHAETDDGVVFLNALFPDAELAMINEIPVTIVRNPYTDGY